MDDVAAALHEIHHIGVQNIVLSLGVVQELMREVSVKPFSEVVWE